MGRPQNLLYLWSETRFGRHLPWLGINWYQAHSHSMSSCWNKSKWLLAYGKLLVL